MNKIKFLVIAIVLMLHGCSNAAGIEDVLDKAKKEGKIVMLELGSVGCIPCEQMRPVMERLRNNYRNKLEVIFVDVRVDRRTAQRYRVFMIPTQIFLDRNGREFHRHIGFYPYEEIEAVLKQKGL